MDSLGTINTGGQFPFAALKSPGWSPTNCGLKVKLSFDKQLVPAPGSGTVQIIVTVTVCGSLCVPTCRSGNGRLPGAEMMLADADPPVL